MDAKKDAMPVKSDDQYGVRWSIITVSFNSSEKLSEYWRDISLPENVEWIVVDNASADGSAEVAEGLGAQVIRLSGNVGFAAANNVGFRRSRGDYVAFVNPDVRPKFSELSILEATLQESPEALVSPQLLNTDGSSQPNGRGEPYLLWKMLHRVKPAMVSARYRIYADDGDRKRVCWLTGAVISGMRARLSELGPWDEYFFVYYEDVDLALRNARSGGDNVLIGSARWTHAWAREASGTNWRGWRLEFSSMVKFYSRYPRWLLPVLPLRKATTPSGGLE